MFWNRREFLTTSSLALVGGAFGRLPLRAQDATPRFEELRRNVGAFHMRGGTIGWLISDDALVVVDSQYPDTASACLSGLKMRSSRMIDVLVNTHHHGDHTGGNKVLRAATREIVSHANVPGLQRRQARQRGTVANQAYPDTTFDENWRMDAGDEVVSARYYGSAHTSGDVVVTFERANIAHLGDLLFNRRDPFVDRPGGASIRGWIKLLPQVINDHDSDTLYIFGHAGARFSVTGAADDLVVQRQYFEAVLEHVERGVAAGHSQEQIASLERLPGMDDHDSTPQSLARVLNVAVEELTAEQ
ncbi:MAG: MBL fold metallo-hydrolase [Acidobacteria bacterium]|nr:MBL fold metallo-hydrolase [Acidobacteriota bacterium]|tara:strand:+ start:2847 stop:3752 length:906 start_codon:yes stop_codon:yes gene_type:complete